MEHVVAATLLHQQPGDAARAIAAGLGHAAVGVADAHEGVGLPSRAGSRISISSKPTPVRRSAMARTAVTGRATGR